MERERDILGTIPIENASVRKEGANMLERTGQGMTRVCTCFQLLAHVMCSLYAGMLVIIEFLKLPSRPGVSHHLLSRLLALRVTAQVAGAGKSRVTG